MAGLLIQGFRCVPRAVVAGGQVSIFFNVIDAETGALVSNAGLVQISSGGRGASIIKLFAADAMTVLRAGMLQYVYEVPATAPLGWWMVEAKTATGEAMLEERFGFEVR